MSNQRCRQICYTQLIGQGYCNLQLYFERKKKNVYFSYWGSNERRMEVLYDQTTDELMVYELAFIKRKEIIQNT